MCKVTAGTRHIANQRFVVKANASAIRANGLLTNCRFAPRYVLSVHLPKRKYMPRMSKDKQHELIETARQLWCKKFDADTISDIIGVAASTVDRWARENDFERSRRSQIIALTEIRNSILESYADTLEGKKPKISPEAAAKYAAAFEKFSSSKQVLTYMYEAFDKLTDQYRTCIQSSKTKQDKASALADLQTLRRNMDIVITKLNNEVLGNESN